MRFTSFSIAVVLTAVATAPAWASTELADKHDCLNCHSVNNKSVGPAFRDIGAKYKTDAQAQEYLAKKVLQGSTGVWGKLAMPGMSRIPAEDVNALVTWVLALP